MRHTVNVTLLALFWSLYTVLFAALSYVAWSSISTRSVQATVTQGLWLIWLAAIVFTLFQRRVANWLAIIATMTLWLPFCVQVLRRLHYWATIGMDAPDGMGSPAAFFLGFVFEWVIFLPLSAMLAVLLFVKPWRASVRADVQPVP